jgi:hypothetical protein
MNAALILEKLEKLSDIKYFIPLLEARFLADESLCSHIKIAKKSLDNALTSLAFDVQKKLENSGVIHRTKIKISDEISNAFQHLEEIDDVQLKQSLQGLVTFSENYENHQNPIFLSAESEEDLKKLKAKILLIIAERFG